jgi:hypothetical protein
MHPEIDRRFEALEQRRKALVDRIRAMSAEQQTKPGTGGGFSPLEVPMHFALVEESNLVSLRKSPPSTLGGGPSKPGFVFPLMVRAMQSGRNAVPAPASFNPTGTFTLDEADQAWSKTRAELSAVLDTVDDPSVAFLRFGFPVGTLNAADFLLMNESHMSYHEVRL